MSSAISDAEWTAVATRDAAHDGRFVYAVRTTGVYCRPSCPSRRPLRAHVAAFATPAEAAAAGFRPCRRCAPDAALAPAAALAERARAVLDAHDGAPLSLAELARRVGGSPHHLQRTFTRVVGTSPARYAAALRAQRLRDALRDGATVSRATFDAGYGAVSRAYDAAEAHLGMTPAAYRRGGRGVAIRWATAPCAVGRVLVAATARGVCAVLLGDDDAALADALGAEFPHAERTRAPADDAALGGWLRDVVARVDGDAGAAALPLDLAGTPFQQRVWHALRAIPRGETRRYADVAAAIGAPRAARAVAAACARNRVALVVPCHRVVPGEGGPGGYRWGAARKARLLAAEARPPLPGGGPRG